MNTDFTSRKIEMVVVGRLAPNLGLIPALFSWFFRLKKDSKARSSPFEDELSVVQYHCLRILPGINSIKGDVLSGRGRKSVFWNKISLKSGIFLVNRSADVSFIILSVNGVSNRKALHLTSKRFAFFGRNKPNALLYHRLPNTSEIGLIVIQQMTSVWKNEIKAFINSLGNKIVSIDKFNELSIAGHDSIYSAKSNWQLIADDWYHILIDAVIKNRNAKKTAH